MLAIGCPVFILDKDHIHSFTLLIVAELPCILMRAPVRLLRSRLSTMRLLKALALLYPLGRLPVKLLSSRVMTCSWVNTLFHPQLAGKLPPIALLDRFLHRQPAHAR